MSAQPSERRDLFAAHINPPVFFTSAALTLAIVVFGAGWPEIAGAVFAAVQGWIVATFGWLYVLAVAVFVVFILVVGLGRFGRIKLGADDAEPEFGDVSWFAMLFSAGMGIGLMFFGVAEPMMHFRSPPVGEGGTVEAAREAMRITFFHWGIHAWAIYAVIGLSLAYFAFRHRLPLTVRSALYPLIGERIHGPIGHAVDVFAVLGTMFGVATSLGLGVLQVNAGLAHLFGIGETIAVQLVLIAVITAMATLSVVAGLDAGIRRLSELNLLLALALVLFVLAVGPTVFLLKALVQNLGAYLGDVVERTFTLYAYEPRGWIGGWTLFYWAWWIAWSPFVGMFIARVSRGRTIREFVLGVLFAPVGFTFAWLTIFGNSAISLDAGAAAGIITAAVEENVPLALFRFLEQLPMAAITALVATLLVVTFFVTSSDSGSLVIDIITSGGEDDPPVWQRIFWAVTEGLVAAVLLLAGGLTALQTASIAAALPFSLVMLLVCYGLWRGLSLEAHRRQRVAPPPPAIHGATVPWQSRLRTIVGRARRDQVAGFLETVAAPALAEVAAEFRKAGLEATVGRKDGAVSLHVGENGEDGFSYTVELRGRALPTFAFPEFSFREEEEDRRTYRAEVRAPDGGQPYNIMGYVKEQVIADVLASYERYRHLLRLAG